MSLPGCCLPGPQHLGCSSGSLCGQAHSPDVLPRCAMGLVPLGAQASQGRGGAHREGVPWRGAGGVLPGRQRFLHHQCRGRSGHRVCCWGPQALARHSARRPRQDQTGRARGSPETAARARPSPTGRSSRLTAGLTEPRALSSRGLARHRSLAPPHPGLAHLSPRGHSCHAAASCY